MTRSPIHLHDHESAAQAVLDKPTWAYFSGAAADGQTHARNLQAWQRWGLRPRVLRPLRDGHTQCHLLGQTWPTPLLVAPMAMQGWAHPDGEIGTAMAAAAQGCGMVLSHQSSTPLQTVADKVVREPGRGPLWFQLYWQSQRHLTLDLLQSAQAAGYEAVVLTVDAPVQGVRDQERRHGLPTSALRSAHWTASAVTDGRGLCAGLANLAPQWDDVQWLIAHSPLPVLLKGVTHPQDAQQAMACGAAGLIVSNHGGRVLDGQAATAETLLAVVQAVRSLGSDAPVLVDGGLRRGTDLFKALALGASAALIGRPVVYGLAHAGAQGAAHVLRLMRDEFESAMTLCGCRTPQDIGLDHLQALPELS